MIEDVLMLDVFEDKRTIRVVYRSPEKTLTTQEIVPIRAKIIETAQLKHKATLVQ
jgi:phenylalanyl-tRNA synthetase beta subunit